MDNLKILIIEDDLFYQTYVNDLLKGSNMEVVNANDGEQGLLFARSEKPDLILTDIEIPKIQGFVLLNQLKEIPETSHIPVIMMSGKVEKDLFDKHAQLSVHAEGYLLKPFSRSELLGMISKVMGQHTPSTPAKEERKAVPAATTDVEPESHRSRPKALVVDDSSYVRDLTRDLLTEAGLDVEIAVDGEDGLRVVRDLMPDIVLLDVQMPKVNGFVVCETLKKDEQTRDVPIILMSAVLDSESFEQHSTFKYRADAYLQKPFKKEELLDLVSKHVASNFTATAVQRKTDFTVPEGSDLSGDTLRTDVSMGAGIALERELREAAVTIESLREKEKMLLVDQERLQRENDQYQEEAKQERRQSEYRRRRLVEKLTLATRRADEAGKVAEDLEGKNRRMQMDLEAALAAKGEIEDQAKSIVENLHGESVGEEIHNELKDLQKDKIEIAARLADTQAQIERLDQLESDLERARLENSELRETLSVSTDRADLEDELAGLKEHLSQAENQIDALKKEKEKLQTSLGSLGEDNSELAADAREAETRLAESQVECERLKLDAQSLKSERAASEKRILELERELEENFENMSQLLEEEKEARSVTEKEAEFARKELLGAEEDRKRAGALAKELEGVSRDLEGVQAQYRVLEKENQLLQNRLSKEFETGSSQVGGGSQEARDRENILAARLDQLEDTLKRTMNDAQSALVDQKGKEEKLEGEMRNLLETLEAERVEHKREREQWRAREDDIRKSMEEFFEERRRTMGEEISRYYPAPTSRTSRPLEVVTGRRKFGFMTMFVLLLLIAFLLGFLVISRVATGDSSPEKTRRWMSTSQFYKMTSTDIQAERRFQSSTADQEEK
ncbi:response regulator [bacterium]|nr:MAG: response regulator [bacterium]